MDEAVLWDSDGMEVVVYNGVPQMAIAALAATPTDGAAPPRRDEEEE
jgi:hypothetical protein